MMAKTTEEASAGGRTMETTAREATTETMLPANSVCGRNSQKGDGRGE